MPGMGLLRKRTRDVRASSEDALQRCQLKTDELQALEAAGGDRAAAVLTVVETSIRGVRSGEGEATSHFVELESLDLLLEQEDSWTGLDEDVRNELCQLLLAAWMAVTKHLKKTHSLDASVVPNWKFVLQRVVPNIENMCSSSLLDTVGPHLDILQDYLEGDADEEHEDEDEDMKDEEEGEHEHHKEAAPSLASANSMSCLISQIQSYEKALGRPLGETPLAAVTKQGSGGTTPRTSPPAREAGGNGSRPTVVIPGASAGPLGDLEEAVKILSQRIDDYMGEDEDEDDDEDDDAGGDSRLAALEDPIMRPILLRVVSRLPADHELRAEVEAEIGAAVGTEEYQAELQASMQAAADAGVALPPVPLNNTREETDVLMSALRSRQLTSAQPSPSPLPMLGNAESAYGGFDVGGVTDGLFSPGSAMPQVDSGGMFHASKSTSLLVDPSALDDLFGAGPSSTTAADMVAPSSMIPSNTTATQSYTSGTNTGVPAHTGLIPSGSSVLIPHADASRVKQAKGDMMSTASAMAMLAGNAKESAASAHPGGPGASNDNETTAGVANEEGTTISADELTDAFLMSNMPQSANPATCSSPGVNLWGNPGIPNVDSTMFNTENRSLSPAALGPNVTGSVSNLVAWAGNVGDDLVGDPSTGFEDDWLAGGDDAGFDAGASAISVSGGGAVTGKRSGAGLPQRQPSKLSRLS